MDKYCDKLADCPFGSDEVECSCTDLDMHKCMINGAKLCIFDEWITNYEICMVLVNFSFYLLIQYLGISSASPAGQLNTSIGRSLSISSASSREQQFRIAIMSVNKNMVLQGIVMFRNFKCPGYYCIPWRYVCDNKYDCPGGADEMSCHRVSCPGQFKCLNSVTCVDVLNTCDNVNDCLQQDDEWFCLPKIPECPFTCTCLLLIISCKGLHIIIE